MGLIEFQDGKPVYYPYIPSSSAGLVFVILFSAVTILHLVRMCRFHTWYFTPMILGGICEIFGYYGRYWAASMPDSPKPFMLQLMLILVAPVFLSGTIYVNLGKLKQAMRGEPKRRCSPTSMFVLADIIAFCSQIGGGLVQVTGNLNIMAIGDRVVLGGLLFQLGTLAIYLTLVLKFYREVTHDSLVPRLRTYTIVLACAVVAVWVRNLVKAIEFAQGFYGFISEHEYMLYTFDGALLLLVTASFAILHPGMLISSDGNYEVVAITRAYVLSFP
ncbi:RTA1 like protein-domain-containing protein [Xylariales sp. PMI_506]|nr:RTA1 like protein-domain-containing protein [Xylariales sp. PMI_506]